MKSSLFVVVPAHNEGSVIRTVILPLLDLNCSVVIVDDGSNDNTWSIIVDLPVYALRHPTNLGQGAALQTGMMFALQQGAETIVHFDADGQHRVQDIPILIEPLQRGEADVVLGSRFLRLTDTRLVPVQKRILLKGAVIVNWFATGIWLSDAHNGFRALTREAAQKIYLRENSFAHASEILAQIHHHRLRYVERPVTIIYSKYAQIKGQPVWNALNIAIDLLMARMFR